jgi:CDP-diacylglycerol--glycerol-3-phosphate 3-phosphatidyltransferase
MKSPSAVNAANLATLLRICLIPIFIILLHYTYRPDTEKTENFFRMLSLAAYILILVSDFLDGQLARRLHLETRLGAILDPAADKLLIATSFGLLAAQGQIPFWLATVVISKDLLSVLGWGVLFMLDNRQTVRPSWTGKLCLLCQDLTILSILLNAPGNLNRWILWPLTTVLTAVTFFGYALEALRESRKP